MKATTRLQLSFMMFLNFFIWGGWFVTLGTYLGKALAASGGEISFAYLTQSIGAIIAPFIIGLIADRFFPAQKILGILHLAGAVLLWYASTLKDFDSFFPVILVYMILYMPTLALVNSISFRQVANSSKDFPLIRVLGTVGWIVAGFTISFFGWDEQNREALLANTFKMVSVASLVLGLFSFTLPNTPPMKKGQKTSVAEMLGLDALRLLKNRSYLLFFLASVAICIPLAFYYNFTNLFLNEQGMKNTAGVQSLGQVSEIAFMILMPLLFVRWGVKRMLAIGMLAWAVRYVLFAYGNNGEAYWMLITGIVLHGICYDFFFVTGQIYTDNLAGERFKSAAQGLITLATYGIGMLIGSLVSGPIVDAYKTGDTHDWKMIWLIPAGIALAVVLLFLLFFRDTKTPRITEENTEKGFAASPIT
ncbi:MAG TPA: nucleoside permease [Flavisolibacter sp.]|jgi:nucleoside transporter